MFCDQETTVRKRDNHAVFFSPVEFPSTNCAKFKLIKKTSDQTLVYLSMSNFVTSFKLHVK